MSPCLLGSRVLALTTQKVQENSSLKTKENNMIFFQKETQAKASIPLSRSIKSCFFPVTYTGKFNLQTQFFPQHIFLDACWPLIRDAAAAAAEPPHVTPQCNVAQHAVECMPNPPNQAQATADSAQLSGYCLPAQIQKGKPIRLEPLRLSLPEGPLISNLPIHYVLRPHGSGKGSCGVMMQIGASGCFNDSPMREAATTPVLSHHCRRHTHCVALWILKCCCWLQ